MRLKLNTIKSNSKKKRLVRVGRGKASGKGKTSGRGHKGQNSRSGHSKRLGFEGGQTPLLKRIPKYGFRMTHSTAKSSFNLKRISNANFGDTIPTKFLIGALKLIKAQTRTIKLFGRKELKRLGG
ncbi:50S ribosomal subunit protein L15 [Candidatus Tremblaya phenacola PAVE]|nr:50S ribosomal subunit protein L15 [Candidatus Tremblaya phenacola PAVE]